MILQKLPIGHSVLKLDLETSLPLVARLVEQGAIEQITEHHETVSTYELDRSSVRGVYFPAICLAIAKGRLDLLDYFLSVLPLSQR